MKIPSVQLASESINAAYLNTYCSVNRFLLRNAFPLVRAGLRLFISPILSCKKTQNIKESILTPLSLEVNKVTLFVSDKNWQQTSFPIPHNYSSKAKKALESPICIS